LPRIARDRCHHEADDRDRAAVNEQRRRDDVVDDRANDAVLLLDVRGSRHVELESRVVSRVRREFRSNAGVCGVCEVTGQPDSEGSDDGDYPREGSEQSRVFAHSLDPLHPAPHGHLSSELPEEIDFS
jgi:hypothetical protein